ncbi:MAG TPA: FG-GAP-like repeat-containing protein, partial [Candidatus Saccharimonadales bacterium]|nr:FG-GAP-like repeat-containing protein [Candidatus Saccharimonadales bacterium]
TVNVGEEPYSVATGDFDQDGDFDLVAANEESHTVSILTNQGSSNFSETSVIEVGEEPWSVIVDDLDRDGDLDLAVVNSDSDNISILLNSLLP